MNVKVKICGLKTKAAVECAVQTGADYLGLVFFDKSPRNISPNDAKALVEYARALNPNIAICAVTVNPSDDLLGEINAAITPDFFQIHGDVSPARVLEIKTQGFKIIYAIGISNPADLAQVAPFELIVDHILFDAKPPKGAANAGGFGISFDWDILADFETQNPWFLSGGLKHENLAAAVAATNAPILDVSSGVESAAGVKDLALIKSFIEAAKGA